MLSPFILVCEGLEKKTNLFHESNQKIKNFKEKLSKDFLFILIYETVKQKNLTFEFSSNQFFFPTNDINGPFGLREKEGE